MTSREIRDILMCMKVVTFGLVAALSLISALAFTPAMAAAQQLDLGFARPGMSLSEFKAFSWPHGVTVRCSGEDDLPPESETVRLAVPRPIAKLGGLRCGLFSQDNGNWRTHGFQLAGSPSEVWGKFFPDRDGTPRLVQLLIKQPNKGFDALADHFASRLGQPQTRDRKLARWETAEAEAVIIHDGSPTLLAYVIDTRLQAQLNTRMTTQPRTK